MADSSAIRTLVSLALLPATGIALAVAGAVQVAHWGALTLFMKVVAVLLLVAGGFLLLAIAAIIALAVLLRRFARNVKRDAKGLIDSIRYMVRMGR